MRRLVSPAARRGVVRYAAALGPTGLAMALQFVVFAIPARGLGVAQFGQYAAITAVAAILIELVGVGAADLLVRGVARDPARYPLYLGNLAVTTAVTFPPVVALGVAVAWWGAGTPLAPLTIAVGLTGEMIAARLSASTESTMIAHGDTVHAAMVRLGANVTRLVAALAYFHDFRPGHSLSGWVWVVLAQSCLLGAVLTAVVVRRYGPPRWTWLRAEAPAGAAFAVNQAARAVQGNVDRLILTRFADSAVVGAYAAGARLLVVGLFPIQVLTRILYPEFFRQGERGIAATRRYALGKAPAMLLTSLFSLAAVMVVAQLLPAVLGREFAASRQAAMLLALALPLIGLQYLAADTLTGAGFQQLRAVLSLGASGVFGVAMVVGARLAGTGGVIAAYLASHLLFLATLVAAALIVRDRAEPTAKPDQDGSLGANGRITNQI